MIKLKRLVNLLCTLAVSWGFIATDFLACQKARADIFDDILDNVPGLGRCGVSGEGTIYVKFLLRQSEKIYVEVDKGGKLSGVKGHELNAQNTSFSTGICNRDGFTVRVYTPIECGKTLLAESRFSRVYNEETVWITEDGIQLEVGDFLNYFTEVGRTALSLIATYYSGGKMAPVALEEASKFEPCLTDSPGCPAAPDLAQKIRSDRCLSAAVKLAKQKPIQPLKLYWSPQKADNFVAATQQGENDALAAGYQYVRIEACIFSSQQPGTVPLNLYWNTQRGDNFTTATNQGANDAIAAGYVFARTEGYVFPAQQLGTVPLNLYWNTQRGDNFTTATSQGANDAIAAGYVFARTEGYVFPVNKCQENKD